MNVEFLHQYNDNKLLPSQVLKPLPSNVGFKLSEIEDQGAAIIF